MRISHLHAPNRCTPGGEHKDNTFSITLEMKASDLTLLISALDWQQKGMEEYLEERGGAMTDAAKEEWEDWRRTIVDSETMENILTTIANVIF